MATKSIGSSGRDFSTIAAWASYASGLTLSAPEVGECYNDSQFTTTIKITIGGWSGGSPTNTVTLKCATGQSFRDNASVTSNALRYNQSNGVGLSGAVDYDTVLVVSSDNVVIDGLQIKSTSTACNGIVSNALGGTDRFTVQNCILQGTLRNDNARCLEMEGANSVAQNNLFLVTSANGGGMNAVSGPAATDLTIVAGTSSGTGLAQHYGTGVTKNVAVAGFAADYFGTAGGGSTNNATDQSSFGGTGFSTSGQVSLVPATEWQNVTPTTEDYRLKSSTSVKLLGHGATTGPGDDIAKQARVAPYTIGCWQAANNNLTISPSVGTLTFTGQAPVIIGALLVTPTVSLLQTLTGYQFSFNIGPNNNPYTPSAGALAITGTTPVITVTTNLAISPTTGTLTITGLAPVVTLGANQFASPAAGALAIVGQAPVVTVGLQVFITPSVGALTITGQMPVVTTENNLPVGPSVTENIRALGQVTSIRAIRGVSGITAIDFTPTEG